MSRGLEVEIQISYDEIKVPVDDGELIFYTTLGEQKGFLRKYTKKIFYQGKGGDDLLKEVEKVRFDCSQAAKNAEDVHRGLGMSFDILSRYAENLITYAHSRDEVMRDNCFLE